jgi:NitT/TauT family transport system substrate-binding protein
MRYEAILRRTVALLMVVTPALSTVSARAAEPVTVSVGTVGQASANIWPILIGVEKGFYAAEDLKLDMVYVQSSAALVQQVTAGSLGVSVSTGLADPLRAVGMGAPIAIARIEVQAPPYDLVAKPSIASIKDLRGMLAPNGVKPGEFDMVFAGATAARASALVAGAVDAAILLPAFNFQAEAKGFHSLGLTVDYVKDLPFSGMTINVAWANANKAMLEKLLRVETRSVAWFEDEKNRAEAVQILKAASGLTQDDVEKSYDFFRNGHFLEPTGKVSRSKLNNLAKAMESLGDLPGALDVDKIVLPGVTQMTD